VDKVVGITPLMRGTQRMAERAGSPPIWRRGRRPRTKAIVRGEPTTARAAP
jgi:hypothetical protein